MEKIRVGIVGHGFMGHEHETMLYNMEGYQIIGISDIDPKQLEDVKPGIKRYSSNEELFADPEIDVVLIVANNNQHHDLVIQAARRKSRFWTHSVSKPIPLNGNPSLTASISRTEPTFWTSGALCRRRNSA